MDYLQEARTFLLGSFGDRVAFGYLFHQLKEVTPDDVLDFIDTGTPLFDGDVDWTKWGELIRDNNLGRHVTIERLSAEFEKRRPDLCRCVRAHPAGEKWFREQIATVRQNLGIEDPPPQWRKVQKPPS